MLDDLISSSNKSLETSLYVLLGSLPISLSSFTGCLGHTTIFRMAINEIFPRLCGGAWGSPCQCAFRGMTVGAVWECAHKQHTPCPNTRVEQISNWIR